MKKILIAIGNLNIGGIQKSLLELLKALSNCPEYEISLFCSKRNGAYLDQIPENVKILPENPYAATTEQPLYECKKQGMKYYFFRLVMSVWSRFFTKAIPAAILCRLVGKIGAEYDIAISYSQPIGDYEFCNLTNEIVLQCVQAKHRITFVHCDFGSYGGNTKRNRGLYKKFDRIAVVSESVGRRFAEIVPEVAQKVKTVYNFCDTQEIQLLASQDPLVYNKNAFVTVARLSEEKGILRCIPIFNRLKKDGFDFEWHIVGGGSLKSAIEEEISRCSLEECIFLEGEQLNPYRHIKNADFFLLPSFHEAAPMVFDEAHTLGVPVLATNTLSAYELVEMRGIGCVCENDDESIYSLLHRALCNKGIPNITDKPNNRVCTQQFNSLCKLQ